MIEAFDTELKAFWEWILQKGLPLAWPLVGLVAVLIAARLTSVALDKKHGLNEREALSGWGSLVAKTMALVALVGILSTILGAGMRSISAYQAIRDEQKFDSRSVVSGAAINQTMPQVALLTTRLQTVQHQVPMPPLGAYLDEKGKTDWDAYLGSVGYEDEEVIGARQTSNGMVSISARSNVTTAAAVVVEKGNLDLAIEPVGDSDPRANAYRLTFRGEYTWRNPTAEAKVTRFSFGLPDHGGTVRDIAVTVGDVKVTSADESGLYRGETTLGPGQSITAKVAYTTEARGNLRIFPGTGLRSIPDLTIKLNSRAPIFFERGSLTPNRNEGGAHIWELKNTVTRQIISIAVPAMRSDREVWWKLGYLVPLALFGFVGLLVGLRETSRPLPLLAASVVAQFAGLTLPILFGERIGSPGLFGLVGALAAVGACTLLLGKRGTAISALSATAMLVGAMGPYTAMGLWAIALVATIWVGKASIRTANQ